MTPEGKTQVNDLLAPYDAEVTTTIEPGQDIRFIKIVTDGLSEDPLNVLDSEGLMVHAEEPIQKERARQVGRPLLRIISVSHHPGNKTNILSLEDINTDHKQNEITPHSDTEQANDRSSRRPQPPRRRSAAAIYPPGHPSLTGEKI